MEFGEEKRVESDSIKMEGDAEAYEGFHGIKTPSSQGGEEEKK